MSIGQHTYHKILTEMNRKLQNVAQKCRYCKEYASWSIFSRERMLGETYTISRYSTKKTCENSSLAAYPYFKRKHHIFFNFFFYDRELEIKKKKQTTNKQTKKARRWFLLLLNRLLGEKRP